MAETETECKAAATMHDRYGVVPAFDPPFRPLEICGADRMPAVAQIGNQGQTRLRPR